MKQPLMTVLLAAAVLLAPAAQSHHSFVAVYDPDRTVSIEGKIVQFLYRNPHSVLHVLVPDGAGGETRYAIEWQSATQLGASGISSQTIRAGDPVMLSGHPGRVEAEHRILLLKIERTTDGFNWDNAGGGLN